MPQNKREKRKEEKNKFQLKIILCFMSKCKCISSFKRSLRRSLEKLQAKLILFYYQKTSLLIHKFLIEYGTY